MANPAELWGWGGQRRIVGTGSNVSTAQTTPVQIGSFSDWDKIIMKSGIVFGIRSNGQLYTWGSNGDYLSGLGLNTGVNTTPQQIGTDSDWQDIFIGNLSSGQVGAIFGLKNNKLFSWGLNAFGATAQGSTTGSTTTPTQVGTDDWKEIFYVGRISFAKKMDGTLMAWGSNYNYGTGLGVNSGTTTTPSAVTLASEVNSMFVFGPNQSLSSGGSAIACLNNGTLVSWGTNASAVTAQGTTSGTTNSPTVITGHSDWSHMSNNIDDGWVYAYRDGGKMYSWATNTGAYNAQGTTSGTTLVPTQVGSLSGWGNPIKLASNGVCMTLRDDGKLMAWGFNGNYTTGTGSNVGTQTTPNQISGFDDFTSFNNAGSSLQAIRDNKLYTLGTNSNAATAQGTTSGSTTTLTQVGTDSDWNRVISPHEQAIAHYALKGNNDIAPTITSCTISGSDIEESTLTCSVSTTGTSPTLTYQWKKDGTNISGATSSTYDTVSGDVGANITCFVTATNGAGSDTETSNAIGPILAKTVPSISSVTITGGTSQGDTLTCSVSVTGIPTPSLTYQWKRDGVDIGGATSSTYDTVSGDVGKDITCYVEATNSEGSDNETSNSIGPIKVGPVITSLTIGGIEVEGNILTASLTATGFPAPTDSFQWQRNLGIGWFNISGATSMNYTLVGADVGATIRVIGEATNSEGTDTETSAPTGVIDEAPAAPVITSCTIFGTAQVGNALTSTVNVTGYPNPTKTYQWQFLDTEDGWLSIPGATASFWTVTETYVGYKIRLRATATNGSGSVSANSNQKGPVIPDDEAPMVSKPTIAGILQVGQELSCVSTVTGYPIPNKTYLWEREDPVTGWEVITGATKRTYILTGADKGCAIRVTITATNFMGSDSDTSDPTGIVSAATKTSLVRIYLHDWNLETIGEIKDFKNYKLTEGISKNQTISFDTTLLSPMGRELADRDYSIISVWRWNPYNETWKQRFGGVVWTNDEKGNGGIPTVSVTGVGPFVRFNKVVANDSLNRGRTQKGLNPTPGDLTLLVADRLGDRIVRYNAKTGAHISNFGSSGTGNGQFDGPRGVAVSPNNFIYVVDTGNNRIQKFNKSGTYVSKWGTTGSGDNQLNNPRDVAVDTSGNVWVTDRGNKRVVKYDADGNFLLKVNADVTYTMDELNGISCDSEGFVYACDEETGGGVKGYYKITPDGRVLSAYVEPLRKLVRDYTGQHYFVKADTQTVYKSREMYNTRRSRINNTGEAQSIQVGDDGTTFVLESNGSSISQIKRYDASGNQTRVIGAWGTGSDETRGAVGFALIRPGSKDGIQIIDDIIDFANTEGNTWIRTPDEQGTSSQVFINPGEWGGYKKVSECIGNLQSGFEWFVEPKLTTDEDGPILGEWTANAILGENKSDSISFEYGTGRLNADDYRIQKSLENLTTKASYPSADTKPYSATVENAEAIDELGIWEEVVSGSVTNYNLKLKLLDIYKRFGATPRKLVEISPARSDQTDKLNTRVPIPGIDYVPGDIIGVEVDDRLEPSEVRIYDIETTMNENAEERAVINTYIE